MGRMDGNTKVTTYIFKNKKYRIFEYTKIKFGDIWIDGVIYECLYDNSTKYFVREKCDFFEKFKPIGENND